ncbi:Ninja-family protein AFP3 [Raphanus sativus]|uniref:Ninja-family protein n=1 Tax=Raphanus sativus TaxID=3726 RepID=A0A6J0N1U0_RAPSA|nr:ninja-family protein AFP3 [Raphanus sativus]KAJ4900878.1 Ninja-family protein AFP3 [Raphanus sativus]
MSESEKKEDGEIYRNIPRPISRDLLQSFMSKKNKNPSVEDGEVEVELDLGLSLNGRFGVDPLAKTRLLTRSSSIPDFVVNDHRSELSRTCSLPVETEEWRKRKELQSLRRLEAKRKRSEKQRNVRVLREKHKSGGEEEKIVEEGSIGSSGSGSSGLSSELDNAPPLVQAITNKTIDTSPPSDAPAARNIIEDMPCVSTTGDGPNGKKIDGFLYRYRKGQEVRIVCVCHGSFLSPAEFIKHAGGSDVAHPLKHIVVNPSPFL